MFDIYYLYQVFSGLLLGHVLFLILMDYSVRKRIELGQLGDGEAIRWKRISRVGWKVTCFMLLPQTAFLVWYSVDLHRQLHP